MTRRAALTVIAGVAGTAGWSATGQTPYGPYGPSTEYRILDLATVREIIIRLPKGNITIQTEELWRALSAKPNEP